MRRLSGFTIIELIVVMVIMAILLTLASFGIGKSLANTRDNQRNTDINIISRGLETRYKAGNSNVTAPAFVQAGSYPDISEMKHIIGLTVSGFSPSTQITGGYSNDALPGTTVQNFSPPGVTTAGPYNGFDIASCGGSCPTVNDSSASGSAIGSAVLTNHYYYEPVDADGKICYQTECVRYNLYWRTEVDSTAHILRSSHQ